MPDAPQQPNQEPKRSNTGTKREPIKALRTFEGDIAEALQQGQTSATKIVAAQQAHTQDEQKKTVVEPANPPNPERKKFLLIISAIIVLTGIIVYAAYLFLKPDERPTPPATSSGQTIISIDNLEPVDVTNLT